MKNYKNKIENDISRTIDSKNTWIDTVIELLPYIVAIVGITTFMIMLGILEEILKR